MRNFYKYLPGALIAFAALGATSQLSAGPHTTIYVHGMKFKDYSYCQGKSSCKGAWDQQRTSPVVHTGWDGRMDPGVYRAGRGSYQLLRNLNTYCRRDQGKSCEIVCGSMGCYTASLTVARYNTSNRYNITHVISLAAADGGSEIGSIAEGIVGTIASMFGISSTDLKRAITRSDFTITRAAMPSRARAAFDHNRNNGVQFYHKVSYVPVLGVHIKGRDDLVVGYSSACAYRGIYKFEKCGGERVKIKSCPPWPFGKKCRKSQYKTITPWTGHHASPSVSRSGLRGHVHGWFSKKGRAYHYSR